MPAVNAFSSVSGLALNSSSFFSPDRPAAGRRRTATRSSSGRRMHGVMACESWGGGATWGEKGGVVGALIQLGLCLDLTDVRHTAELAGPFEAIREKFAREGTPLPENRGKRRDLDCLVINSWVESASKAGINFQTVRCP